jgi:Na+-driven multidrug efflux pump
LWIYALFLKADIRSAKLGQKREREANEIFTFVSIMLLILSIVFTIAGILFLKPICVFLGSSERLLTHVLPYTFVIFLGSIPMSFKLFFEYLVRTDGNPGVGMMMSMTGLILNVVFDFIFVALLDMGTFGAAWGTFLSIAISMLISFNYFRKHSHIRFCKPKVNWSVLVKSCTNGSSEMLTEMSTGITTLLFNLIIMRYFGEDGVAAVMIIMYIYYFFISFYMGIAVATAPIVSYNACSENYGKIRETTRYSFITIAVSSVLIMAVSLLFGKQIIHLFVKDGSVFTITRDGLKLFSPVFLFIGWNVFLSGYFTALGNGLISALISSPRSLIFVVAFILTLPKLIGVSGIWLTMPLSEAVTIFIAVYLYRTQGRCLMQNVPQT